MLQTFLRQRTTLASTKTTSAPEQHKSCEMTVKEKILPTISSAELEMPSKTACEENQRYTSSSTRSTSPITGHECFPLAGSMKKEQYNVRRTPSGQMGTISSCYRNDCHGNYNGNICQDACSVSERKALLGSIKSKDNLSGSGVLRYALHLRFLCPPVKKYSDSVQGCRSDPLNSPRDNIQVNEQERRFYLYNDMRVVFPQRHTDSDEGKVCYRIV